MAALFRHVINAQSFQRMQEEPYIDSDLMHGHILGAL